MSFDLIGVVWSHIYVMAFTSSIHNGFFIVRSLIIFVNEEDDVTDKGDADEIVDVLNDILEPNTKASKIIDDDVE